MSQICFSFKRKFLENIGEGGGSKIFQDILSQCFVKSVERSIDEEETKMTTTAPSYQTNDITSIFPSWFYSCHQVKHLF